jgi:hypothetical protein
MYIDHSPECMEHWEVDGVKDRVRSAKVTEQHDEEPVVCQLMKVGVTTLVVVMEDSGYRH